MNDSVLDEFDHVALTDFKGPSAERRWLSKTRRCVATTANGKACKGVGSFVHEDRAYCAQHVHVARKHA